MGNASQKANRAVSEAASASRSPALRILARAGFVFIGLVHILIGFIALQIDRGQGGQADQSGAIGSLASKPGGAFLLWAGFAACAALALWMVSEAVFEARSEDDSKKKLQKAGAAVGKAVVFGFLAFTFSVFASGGSKNSSQSASDFTAKLMGSPAGVVLLIAVGLAIIGAGVFYVYRGVTRKFMEDLQDPGNARTAVEWIGTIGYAAKGVVLAVVGILVIVAAATADPSKSSGLDGGLKTLGSQPYGVFLLAAIAAGLVCYGVYSMARARYGRF
jgi:succinate dehydrogenase/fumarate reductase cytochrome b subunit